MGLLIFTTFMDLWDVRARAEDREFDKCKWLADGSWHE